MVVLVLERVPTSLRGELTRWMLEPKTGVFVGTMSALVREQLWEKVSRDRGVGAGMLAYSSDTEQGFRLEVCGETSRRIEDFDGLSLIRIP